MTTPRHRLFVTAAAGTEKPLKEELRELGMAGVKGDRGGVHLEGDVRAVTRICLASRIAVRVMIAVDEFACPDEDALYQGIRRIAWERWLSPRHTLSVNAVCRDSALRHSKYVAQKTKDAVVDRQRSAGGTRSSVDRHDADVVVFVRIKKDQAQVFLDASGDSLHRRGWRRDIGEAPLKETLAAAIIRLSGWDRQVPLVDPLCGSGTLVIEGELLARNVPAQPRERRFGFERWADHGEAEVRAARDAREELATEITAEGPRCLGRDRDPEMIAAAEENARRARSRASFEVGRLSALSLDEPSHLIANPPYGQRIEADRRFFDELRSVLARLTAHKVSLLLPEGAPENLVEGRYARGHRLYNGKIPCRLVTWDVR